MEDVYEKIAEAYLAFANNAEKAIEGNKSAGVRSRKASSELEKLLKEWRKISVKN